MFFNRFKSKVKYLYSSLRENSLCYLCAIAIFDPQLLLIMPRYFHSSVMLFREKSLICTLSNISFFFDVSQSFKQGAPIVKLVAAYLFFLLANTCCLFFQLFFFVKAVFQLLYIILSS